MRNFLKEFKDFIATGNMIELAVAVILGAVVGAVIKAFTDGIMMQIVAAVFGKPNFDDITITLRENVETDMSDPANPVQVDAELQIGTFLNTVITLVLTGLVLFVLIKAYNRLRRRAAEEPVTDPGPSQIELLTEIRDALRSRPPV